MQHQDYVLDVVRAMYAWAADPERGQLIPEGFRNPFLRRGHKQSSLKIGEPDISAAMAAEFLGACDEYQLRLFSPMALYGLRAAKPCFPFHEHLDNNWLKVPCLPELAYDTEGHREKRLPVIPCIAGLSTVIRSTRPLASCMSAATPIQASRRRWLGVRSKNWNDTQVH
jgi:hypothetical protein